MKKKMKKFLFAWTFVLCLILPTEVLLAEESTTEGQLVQKLDSGAIAVQFTEISDYRNEKKTYADKNGTTYEYYTKTPDAPEGYAGWLFSGWYTENACEKESALGNSVTSGSAWAKFVPADILSVKAQISAGTFYDSPDAYLRFVTTVDSLNYARVGFDFIIEGEERLGRDSKTVYEFLYAIGNTGKKLNYTPGNIFHSMSQYFVIHTFSGIPNEAFGHGLQVTPYWVTLDGTKVSGEQDIKSVNQGYTSWIKNVTTDDEQVKIFSQGNGLSLASQGGCMKGNYYYQAVIDRSSSITGILPTRYNENKNKVTIQKYDLIANQVIASSAELPLNHANDMTYNEELTYGGDAEKSGLLVIAHNGGSNDEVDTKNRISFMDPDNMKLVEPNKIIGIDWTKSSATVHDEYITIDTGVYAIDYNAIRNQYIVGIAGERKFSIYDANFKQVSGPYNLTAPTTYTKQGVSSDDSYIYFIYYKENKIEVFDWNGQFVTLIATDIEVLEEKEPENISIYNNEIYIACGDHSNHNTELYKVSSVVKPDNEAMIQDTEDSEITYYYPTLELALLEAQEGDTITIVKENITVNSPMEVVADNVTITNQSDIDVTITRGSSLTDNVFENRANNFVIKSSGEHTLTVDGASVKGKSIIYNESDASVELNKITIQNFRGIDSDGASALSNLGTMRLQESTFKNNSARTGGVLYAYSGNIVIDDCSMTNNQSTNSGGAIRTKSYADTNLIVKNSTFDGNTANNGNGGAINFCGGEITVIDTTFQNNQIIKGTGGGALVINENSTGILKTTDSYTGRGFYNNSGTCGGAIYTNLSEVHIEGYTFDSNKATGTDTKGRGGALLVWNNDNTSVDNVTFIDNTARAGQAIYNRTPSFEIHNSRFETSDAEGYMIYQDNAAVTLKLSDTTFTGNGKIHLGANISTTAELSGRLTNATIVYGASVGQNVTIGSNTLDKASTVTLQPSSSYYNDGTSVLTKGSNVNEERLANAVAVVKLADNPTDVTGEWYISDDGKMVEGLGGYTVGTGGKYPTLKDALKAEEVTSGTTLYVLNDLTVNEKLEINKNIVLKNHPNNAANGVTISRGTTDALFEISSGCKLSVRGIITLDGKKVNYPGIKSLIVNSGTLSMGQNVTIQDASSSTSGGAITTSGDLVAEGTSFINNASTASKDTFGGAIYIAKGDVSALEGCTFTGNTAPNGGAIGSDNVGNTVNITNGIRNSKFNENIAMNYRGGAIYYGPNKTNTLVIDSCEFSKNEVKGSSGTPAGGAIWTNRTMEIKGNGLFKENSSSNRGGAIYATNGNQYNITGQTFKNNSAKEGGTVCNFNAGATFSITDSIIVSNSNTSSPIYSVGTTTLSNVAFSGGNKEIALPNATSRAIISGKITDAVFVYKNADVLVTVASTGIDATSTLSLTPMKYNDGAQVLGRDGDSDVAREALANAAKIIEVTQEATQSGAKWWTITSEGKLNCSAIVSSDSAVADFTSLEAAISEMPAGAVIYINANETIANTITIDKAITLKTSTEGVTLTRGNAAEMFNVTSSGSLTVEGAITLDGNKAAINGTNSLIVNAGTLELGKGVVVKNASFESGNGGAIYSTGTLAVTDAIFQDNTAKAGGAVYINGGTASFKGTEDSESAIFNGNTASGKDVDGSSNCVDGGGAIYVQSGTVTSIEGYKFEENQGQDGGAIVVNSSGVIQSVKNSYFDNNHANKDGNGGRGGAIYHRGLSSEILEIESCTFVNNTANNSAGGAIWANKNLVIKGKGFFENNSTSYGGAIYVTSDAICSIEGQTFKNNESKYIAGAICFYNANSEGIINDSEFINNSAVDNGGAIYSNGKLDVSDAAFAQNTAKAGGAVYINGGTASFEGTEDSESSIFSGNIASGKEFDGSNCKDGGGAIYVQSGTVTLIDGYTFEENKGQDGGAIVVNPSGAIRSLKNSYFDKNQAIKNGKGGRGGAIYNRGSLSVTLEIENCTFVNNTAKNSEGGAIWANRYLVIKGEGLFENNSASTGGAICARDYTYSITGQNFKNNTAAWGGGAICFYNANATGIIDDSHFVNNIAENNGGAIYNNGKVTMDALSTFTGNQSKAGGDNVTSDDTTIIAGLYNNGTFTFNTESKPTE